MLNTYIGLVFGGLLNVSIDLAIVYSNTMAVDLAHFSASRYLFSTGFTAVVYTVFTPSIEWTLCKETFQPGPWILSIPTCMFFSLLIPYTGVVLTETLLLVVQSVDPYLKTRLLMTAPIGFFLVHLLETGNILNTYRTTYLGLRAA